MSRSVQSRVLRYVVDNQDRASRKTQFLHFPVSPVCAGQHAIGSVQGLAGVDSINRGVRRWRRHATGSPRPTAQIVARHRSSGTASRYRAASMLSLTTSAPRSARAPRARWPRVPARHRPVGETRAHGALTGQRALDEVDLADVSMELLRVGQTAVPRLERLDTVERFAEELSGTLPSVGTVQVPGRDPHDPGGLTPLSDREVVAFGDPPCSLRVEEQGQHGDADSPGSHRVRRRPIVAWSPSSAVPRSCARPHG